MKKCRQLTKADENLVSEYLKIFNTQLNNVSQYYTEEQLKTARETYTPKNVLSNIISESEKKFIGHFNGNSLDGILIEGERDSHIANKRESLIYWMMVRETGKGIGSDMLKDCIERAKETGKAFVYLSVAENNPAKRLYEKFGFLHEKNYGETNQMVLMALPIK